MFKGLGRFENIFQYPTCKTISVYVNDLNCCGHFKDSGELFRADNLGYKECTCPSSSGFQWDFTGHEVWYEPMWLFNRNNINLSGLCIIYFISKGCVKPVHPHALNAVSVIGNINSARHTDVHITNSWVTCSLPTSSPPGLFWHSKPLKCSYIAVLQKKILQLKKPKLSNQMNASSFSQMRIFPTEIKHAHAEMQDG